MLASVSMDQKPDGQATQTESLQELNPHHRVNVKAECSHYEVNEILVYLNDFWIISCVELLNLL